VKGIYRSASTWTVRQAKALSGLTTRCARLQDKGEHTEATCSELQEPLASSSDKPIEEIVPTEVEVSRNVEAEAAKIDEIASTVKREADTKASAASRSRYLSDIWAKATSFAWKRKVTDVESSDDPENGQEDEVEGVFNASSPEGETFP